MPGARIDCTAWRPRGGQLGVPGRLAHLLVPYLQFYNTSREAAGASFRSYNLARLLIRLLSRKTYERPQLRLPAVPAPMPVAGAPRGTAHEGRALAHGPLLLTFIEDTWGYLEVNPAVTIAQRDGIQMLIGTFDLWFGTPNASALRRWCIARGWPLAWAHDPIDSTLRCDLNISSGGCSWPARHAFVHGVEPANTRLLDPIVLQHVPHGHNLTRTAGFGRAAAAFEAAVARVNRSVPLSLNVSSRRTLMDAHWRELLGSEDALFSNLAMEPRWHAACADESCVGVRVWDGACVCPQGKG